ncbi:RNA polymerase I specific transcription initiation factor RRN3 [Trinorchestia longiramus]|nr:RNA polymerase I specific transcription initiation factor RRN3 [Trinorchestia longiramus]
MLVNNYQDIPPILKRTRSHSSSIQHPEAKRVAVNPIAEKCVLLLERLRETGLVSSYSAELEELASSSEDVQLEWLLQFTYEVVYLDKSISGFVSEVLKLPWKLSESEALRNAYQNFVVALVTAHSGHCKTVLSHLFGLLLPDANDVDQLLLVNPHAVNSSMMTVAECSMQAIVLIHAKVPLSERILLEEANNARPYYKKHPHLLLVFTKCLMMLSLKIPSLRRTFLEMIIQRMVDIDANCPREEADASDTEDEEECEEIFKMEMDEDSSQYTLLEQQNKERLEWILQNPLMHSLDVLMDAMVLFIHCTVHDVPYSLDRDQNIAQLKETGCLPGSVKLAQATGVQNDPSSEQKHQLTLGCACGGEKHDMHVVKKLYDDLSSVFTQIVLPTHSSGHVQFFMFYFLSIKPSLTRIFLEMLRTDSFMGSSVALDVKKNALAYMGSLLVRGKFVAIPTALSCLEVIVNWCQEYISLQEKEGTNNYVSLALHEKFYCACQTVFYVFTFRCREFTKNEKMLDHVRRLNLERLVFCKMNPLAVCRNQIVKNFAAVTRHFQLAYCYAIIESNRRNTLPVTMHTGEGVHLRPSLTGSALDMTFPFDPYQLFNSAPYIESHYQQFPGLPEFINMDADIQIKTKDQEGTEDEDDFLDQSCPGTSASRVNSFLECQVSPTTGKKT